MWNKKREVEQKCQDTLVKLSNRECNINELSNRTALPYKPGHKNHLKGADVTG
jgi:hypothetical protein